MTTTLHPVRRTVGDVVRGVASLVAVLVLLVGIPAALLVVAGNPLPSVLPSLDAVAAVLTQPDDGSLFVAALAWLAWIGWATFAVAVLVEIPAQIRGRATPHLPAIGPQQRAAAMLVASIAVLVASPVLIASPPANALAPPSPGRAAAAAFSRPTSSAPVTTCGRSPRHTWATGHASPSSPASTTASRNQTDEHWTPATRSGRGGCCDCLPGTRSSSSRRPAW